MWWKSDNIFEIIICVIWDLWFQGVAQNDNETSRMSFISSWTNQLYRMLCSVFLWPSLDKWRRQWHPTPVLLPGKSHGRRSLVGCSPRGLEQSDTTEQLHFHFSLSCIGEGNGNPLQRSCLENPKDGGAWWAAIYGVAQSRTQPKRLSSSSSLDQRHLKIHPHSTIISIYRCV